MGWAYGEVNGREVGYSVEAVCDQEGCEVKIDRGLAYCCGVMHGGGEHGCGDYFCDDHLLFGGHIRPGGLSPGSCLCQQCMDRWESANPDPDDLADYYAELESKREKP
jgi:hypothetical protein